MTDIAQRYAGMLRQTRIEVPSMGKDGTPDGGLSDWSRVLARAKWLLEAGNNKQAERLLEQIAAEVIAYRRWEREIGI